MPQRGIDSNLWIHCDFETISIESKLLFIYLCTSPRGNQSGLYRITYRGISKDTGLSEPKIPTYLTELSVMDVVYYPEEQIVWIKNFLRYQAHSPQYLQAVAKCLSQQKDKSLIIQYLEYNNTLSIPYEYPIDTVNNSENTVCPSVLVLESESVLESGKKPIKKVYGQFNNVKLTDDEYQKLKERFNSQTEIMIENLSEYIASKGKKYSNHYATILRWSRQDNKEVTNEKRYTLPHELD